MMVGFEPTTLGLWFPCSTIELHRFYTISIYIYYNYIKAAYLLNIKISRSGIRTHELNELTDSLANYCLKPDLAIRPKI